MFKVNVNSRHEPSAPIRLAVHGLFTFSMLYTFSEGDKIDFSEIKLVEFRDIEKYRYFTCTFIIVVRILYLKLYNC